MTTAYTKDVEGQKILIKVGDGASPEVFTPLILITASRGFTITGETVQDDIVDTANPDSPAYRRRQVKVTDFKVDGSGMLDITAINSTSDWAQSGAAKNCKVVLNATDPLVANTTTYTGAFVCTSFQVTGDRMQASTCQVTLEQASPVIRS